MLADLKVLSIENHVIAVENAKHLKSIFETVL